MCSASFLPETNGKYDARLCAGIEAGFMGDMQEEKEIGEEQRMIDEWMFWNQWTQLLPLYEAFKDNLLAAYPDTKIKVSKSQISFYNRHMFAMVSPPIRRRKDWPKEFIMVSFGLPYQIDSSRIAMSVEAYPNRWTHHVIVETVDAIDKTLLAWIDEAYSFSESKR